MFFFTSYYLDNAHCIFYKMLRKQIYIVRRMKMYSNRHHPESSFRYSPQFSNNLRRLKKGRHLMKINISIECKGSQDIIVYVVFRVYHISYLLISALLHFDQVWSKFIPKFSSIVEDIKWFGATHFKDENADKNIRNWFLIHKDRSKVFKLSISKEIKGNTVSFCSIISSCVSPIAWPNSCVIKIGTTWTLEPSTTTQFLSVLQTSPGLANPRTK